MLPGAKRESSGWAAREDAEELPGPRVPPARAFPRTVAKLERLVADRRALGWDQLKTVVLYFPLMRGAVPHEQRFPRLIATPWSRDLARRYLGGDVEGG